jgi:hypothetical protein
MMAKAKGYTTAAARVMAKAKTQEKAKAPVKAKVRRVVRAARAARAARRAVRAAIEVSIIANATPMTRNIELLPKKNSVSLMIAQSDRFVWTQDHPEEEA